MLPTCSRNASIDNALRTALRWWLNTLENDIIEEHRWAAPKTPPAYLFVDARGVPPRCAAILFIDNECFFTDAQPADSVVDRFQTRCDNQITSLEILAISVGLSTFATKLGGRRVIVYSDNVGAEVSHCFALHLALVVLVLSGIRSERGVAGLGPESVNP